MQVVSVIISLLLSSIVIGGSLTTITRLQSVGHHLNLLHRERVLQNRLHLQISNAIASLDSLRQMTTVIIQPGSAVRNRDGAPNSLQRVSPKLRPHPTSDVMTTVRLDTPHALRVMTSSKNSTGVTFSACALSERPGLTEMERGFAGITVNGAISVVGTPSPRPGAPGCFTLTAQSSATITLPNARSIEELQSVRCLVPILHEHTIYVSQSNELRLVSQRGGAVIENQPLFTGVRTLTITSNRLSGPLSLSIEANLLNSDRIVTAAGRTLSLPLLPLTFLAGLP